MFGYPYSLEYICSITATLRTEVIGPLPEGIRINAYITGGHVDGPKLRGKLRPGGADFLTLRRDGITVLDIRATGETHDGALIYVIGSGLGYGSEDRYERALKGEPPSTTIPVRVGARLSTAHSDYLWVNRLQFLEIAEVDPTRGEVRGDLYAVK